MTPEDGVTVGTIDSRRSAADRGWFQGIVVELLSDLYGTALRLTRNRAGLQASTVVRSQSAKIPRGYTRRTLGQFLCEKIRLLEGDEVVALL